MDVVLVPLLGLLVKAIDIYMYVVIAGVVMSWLVAFRVINTSNRFVGMVGDFLYRITEPALRPIRNLLPAMGGFDLSPVVLILVLWAVQEMIIRLILRIG